MVRYRNLLSPPTRCLRIILAGMLFASAPAMAILESVAEGGCNIQPLHELGHRGDGVRIGLITCRHARSSHEAFFDKAPDNSPTGDSHVHIIDQTDPPSYEPDWHDTPMTGIIISRGGAEYPNHLGMAPAAEVYNAKVTQPNPQNPQSRLFNVQWLENSLDQLAAEDVKVALSGFQLAGTEADGQNLYALMYDYYADEYDILFTNAAGNASAGITPFGDGYNGITVAGLVYNPVDIYTYAGSTSNPGPTADGRRKPDLATPAKSLWVPAVAGDTAWSSQGHNGETSWAAPHAAGCAAVLLGYAQTTDEPDDARSEVIKAVLVNSTFPNINDKSNQSTTGQVWHPHRGFGRLDAWRAFETLSAGRVVPSSEILQEKGWARQVIDRPHQQDVYTVSGLKDRRLLLTLTWHRRVTKNGPLSYTAESPAFRLDLTVSDPSGQVIFSETDTPDNLRKADLLLPADGLYEITVRNTTSRTNRDYALAFELLPPIAADFNIDYIVDISDLTALSSLWLQTGCAVCPVDLVVDSSIDLRDFSSFSGEWLETDYRYYPLP